MIDELGLCLTCIGDDICIMFMNSPIEDFGIG